MRSGPLCAAPTGWRQRRPARGRRDLGYTATHTVTQAEIDSNGGGDGDIDNTATADSDQTGTDSADASVPVEQNLALTIVKEARCRRHDRGCGGRDAINYTITVANTGNTTLTGVVVTDPNADAGTIVRGADVVGDNDGLLEVGETWTYTAAHTVTQAEIDSNGGGDGDLSTTFLTILATPRQFFFFFFDPVGDTTTGTVNINVQDDVPTANSGPAMTVIETDGVTSGTNLLANDVPGADGATVTAVDFGLGGGFQAIAAAGTTTLSTVNGTYTFQANGAWTFDPNANLNNASGISAGFTYQITDGDGDPSTATQVVTVNDGAVAATPTR